MKILRIAVFAFMVSLLGAACSSESVFSLEVGSCFNDEEEVSEEITSVPTVECSEAHDNEVFALFDVADGDFPGEDTVQELAFVGCQERFQGFVGIPYDDSVLALYAIYPTADSWDSGDREVICALYDAALTPLEGSMQGSNR